MDHVARIRTTGSVPTSIPANAPGVRCFCECCNRNVSGDQYDPTAKLCLECAADLLPGLFTQIQNHLMNGSPIHAYAYSA